MAAICCLSVLAAGCSSDDSEDSEDSTGQDTSADTSESTSPSAAALEASLEWMDGFEAEGTPEEYNKVGVLAVGDDDAPNVLVLQPGTSSSAAYFVPLARDIVEASPDWQVWAVERRQNLLEDHSRLDSFDAGEIGNQELFDYYLGYLNDPTISDRHENVPDDTVGFAKNWGLEVAVEDTLIVVGEAAEKGGKVVLGGHSLGGSVTTAFATWDFDGNPGAEQLDGLVYIDGGSRSSPLSVEEARAALEQLEEPGTSPWLTFGGIPAPFAGLFMATGSSAALLDPDAASLGAASGLLPAEIVPPVPATNAGQFGYALNVGSSPENLAAAQAHLGTGITDNGGWDGTGAITPIGRYAEMFSGAGIEGADGAEWYFPQRLTNDTRVIANGNANPAQEVLGVRSTLGDQLPEGLFIYAFGASLGGERVTSGAAELAQQSGIPREHLTLIASEGTYAHNDPAGASPDNEFLSALGPFLEQVAAG